MNNKKLLETFETVYYCGFCSASIFPTKTIATLITDKDLIKKCDKYCVPSSKDLEKLQESFDITEQHERFYCSFCGSYSAVNLESKSIHYITKSYSLWRSLNEGYET
jgi:hypothetical protein